MIYDKIAVMTFINDDVLYFTVTEDGGAAVQADIAAKADPAFLFGPQFAESADAAAAAETDIGSAGDQGDAVKLHRGMETSDHESAAEIIDPAPG